MQEKNIATRKNGKKMQNDEHDNESEVTFVVLLRALEPLPVDPSVQAEGEEGLEKQQLVIEPEMKISM